MKEKLKESNFIIKLMFSGMSFSKDDADENSNMEKFKNYSSISESFTVYAGEALKKLCNIRVREKGIKEIDQSEVLILLNPKSNEDDVKEILKKANLNIQEIENSFEKSNLNLFSFSHYLQKSSKILGNINLGLEMVKSWWNYLTYEEKDIENTFSKKKKIN